LEEIPWEEKQSRGARCETYTRMLSPKKGNGKFGFISVGDSLLEKKGREERKEGEERDGEEEGVWVTAIALCEKSLVIMQC
jgi:hypothetical protein